MLRLSRLFMLVLVVVTTMPAVASAAAVREYQLQFAPAARTGGALAIVSALLDPQESLPASVTVPVPTGATLLWIGEILGGDPSADLAREFSVERVGDMDVYSLTLEQAYTAQAEIQLPAPASRGSEMHSALTWTNPGAEVLFTCAVIVEPGGIDVETSPDLAGVVRTNAAGESLYPLAGRRLAQGEAYEVIVGWKRGGGAAELPGAPGTLPWVLGALVAAIAALVLVIVWENTRRRRGVAANE
ncbi:MAG: hypothetical protein ACYC6J_08370 [Coriobacteriia bacterium]